MVTAVKHGQPHGAGLAAEEAAAVGSEPSPGRPAIAPAAGTSDRAGAAAPTIRDATRADAAAIRRVAERIWPVAYTRLFTEAEMRGFLRWAYHRATLWTEIAAAAAGRGEFLVAERDAVVVGYLHYVRRGRRGPELRRLYADPDHLGTGVGTALLGELHRRLGPGAAYVVRVHPGNRRALDFYRRWGFEQAGRVPSPPRDGCDLLLSMTVADQA